MQTSKINKLFFYSKSLKLLQQSRRLEVGFECHKDDVVQPSRHRRFLLLTRFGVPGVRVQVAGDDDPLRAPVDVPSLDRHLHPIAVQQLEEHVKDDGTRIIVDDDVAVVTITIEPAGTVMDICIRGFLKGAARLP